MKKKTLAGQVTQEAVRALEREAHRLRLSRSQLLDLIICGRYGVIPGSNAFWAKQPLSERHKSDEANEARRLGYQADEDDQADNDDDSKDDGDQGGDQGGDPGRDQGNPNQIDPDYP